MGAQLDHARQLVAQVDIDQVLDALERLDQARRQIAVDNGLPAAAAGARWWCGQCCAFITHPVTRCRKCRHDGPHHYGEDAPTGPTPRRARLRREHRNRNRRRL